MPIPGRRLRSMVIVAVPSVSFGWLPRASRLARAGLADEKNLLVDDLADRA
jgi:hypothetical protein